MQQRVNALLGQMGRDARAVVEPALRAPGQRCRSLPIAAMSARAMRSASAFRCAHLAKGDGAKLKAEFEKLYEQVYGLRIPDQEAEAITWSVTVSITSLPSQSAPQARLKNRRQSRSANALIYDPALGRSVPVPVYWRFDMEPGAKIKGPAIIAEDETSTIVGANFAPASTAWATSSWRA